MFLNYLLHALIFSISLLLIYCSMSPQFKCGQLYSHLVYSVRYSIYFSVTRMWAKMIVLIRCGVIRKPIPSPLSGASTFLFYLPSPIQTEEEKKRSCLSRIGL